jgi:hypothetical protein
MYMKTQLFKNTISITFLITIVFTMHCMDKEQLKKLKKDWSHKHEYKKTASHQRYIRLRAKKHTFPTPCIAPQNAPTDYRDPMLKFVTGDDGYIVR